MNKVTLPKLQKSEAPLSNIWIPSNGRDGVPRGLWQNIATGEVVTEGLYRERVKAIEARVHHIQNRIDEKAEAIRARAGKREYKNKSQ